MANRFESQLTPDHTQDEAKEVSSRERLLKQLEEIREKLLASGSEKLAEEAASFLAGKKTTDELYRDTEKIQDIEQLRAVAIGRLIEGGFIEIVEHQEIDADIFVIDPSKIAGIDRETLRRVAGPLSYDEDGKARNKPSLLALIFRNLEAITPEQADHSDFNVRPFLYIPETAEAAIDPERIKKTDFQTSLWELTPILKEATEEYPVADGPAANALETHLATVLFHPSYGDGYRDDRGVLYVRDPETHKYKKFSTNTLSDYNISEARLSVQGGKVVRSSRQGLAELTPNLIKKGVLRKEDFGVVKGAKTGKYYERAVRENITGPYVMFNRVNHYVGRGHRGATAIQLNATTGGIIELDDTGAEKLTHVFNIFDKSKFPEPKNRGDYALAGNELTNLRPFIVSEFDAPHRSSETEAAYTERTAVVDFAEFIKITQDLAKIGVGFNAENPAAESGLAQAVRTLSSQNRYDDFLTFAKKIGELGVSALVAAGNDAPYVEAILKIGEKLPADQARKFFAETNQDSTLASLDTENESDLAIKEKISQNTRELYLRYANGEASAKSPVETQKALDRTKIEISVFANTLKIARETANVSVEDLRGTEIAIVATTEFSKKDRTTMLSLFKDVREHDSYTPEHLASLESGLKEVLESGKGRFYVVRHDGDIIAFVRFEDLPNGNVYAGSFTTSQNVRGSTLGSALIQAAFAQENATKTLEAIVFSGNPRLMEYHTKVLGHEILRDQTLKIGDALYYKMIRRPQNQTARPAAAA